MIMKNTKSNST